MTNNKKDTAYECAQREFYEACKERKDEVEEVLQEAKERGWHDFKTWYTQEYDWRFLNDILGGVKNPKLSPFDYCRLIHIPAFEWTDSEGTKHHVEFSGTHSPSYYGFSLGNVEGGTGITVDKSYDEESEATVWTINNAIELSTDTATGTYEVLKSIKYDDKVWTLPTAEVTASQLNEVKEKVNEKSTVEVSTQKVEGAATIYSVNVDGNDYNLPEGQGGSTTVDTEMSDTSENAVQNKVIKSYVDEKIPSEHLYKHSLNLSAESGSLYFSLQMFYFNNDSTAMTKDNFTTRDIGAWIGNGSFATSGTFIRKTDGENTIYYPVVSVGYLDNTDKYAMVNYLVDGTRTENQFISSTITLISDTVTKLL